MLIPAPSQKSLVTLSKEIVAYDMTHNTESEACDLLMEIECLGGCLNRAKFL